MDFENYDWNQKMRQVVLDAKSSNIPLEGYKNKGLDEKLF